MLACVLQYYFETIFPRIPKKVELEIMEGLKARGLPTRAAGNGGQGGPDRRGVDDANRRPASVKASLSVAFGQRAPNRAGAREDGRGRDPSFAARDAGWVCQRQFCVVVRTNRSATLKCSRFPGGRLACK